MGSLDSILSINFGFYQRGKVKQHWSFNKRYCHFDCSFIMPTWHPFLHHFTIVFQLQEIIKAIYAADAANGSFYYKSVFHPGGLRAKPDPHSRHSKKVTLFSGETVTPAKFWIGGLNNYFLLLLYAEDNYLLRLRNYFPLTLKNFLLLSSSTATPYFGFLRT